VSGTEGSGSGATRRTIVAVLVVAACLLAPAAITALWLKGTILDTHRYVATVAPLSSNKAVDDAVAAEVTSALLENVDVAKLARTALPKDAGFLALPLTAGVRDYTQELVVKFLRTEEFRQLWVIANSEAQQALLAVLEGRSSPFVAPDGSIDIDLSNITAHAREAVGLAGLDLYDKVKPASLHRRLEIAKPKSLGRVRHAVNVLRRLAIGLPVVALGLAGLALAISRERRRTVFWIGAGLAAAAIGALAGIAFARTYYLDHVVGPDVPPAAARALYETLLRNLRLDLELATLAGILLAAVAALAGPSRLAVRLRSRTLSTAGGLADGATGESVTLGWVAANKGTLRTVAVIAALLLLLVSGDLTIRRLVEIAIGLLLVLGALEILARPAPPGRRRAT
jgi:hypothetical protein